jgi:hypothetical protein
MGDIRVVHIPPPKSYGFWKFVGDAILTILTGGLWLIYVFVREMRRR